MAENEQQASGPQSLLELWLRTSSDFWTSMMFPDQTVPDDSGNRDASNQQTRTRTQESFESSMKAVHAFTSSMAKPDAMEAMAQGVNAFPEVLLKIIQPAWHGFFHLQQEWIKRVGRIGQATSGYGFDTFDQETLKVLTDVYEKEFRQFLNIPQVGLTRVYQEHLNLATDRFAMFQSSMAEFLSLLYGPVEKSLKVMQERLAEMADSGKVPQNAKDYYRMWIKVLEGHYMNLFKSPEYTETLRRTLDSIGEFMTARRQMLEDAIQTLPVPTQKEMDELYKEMYLLKKKLKELEKRIPRSDNSDT